MTRADEGQDYDFRSDIVFVRRQGDEVDFFQKQVRGISDKMWAGMSF